VDDAGLRDQLREFADAGYSAIEIQPCMSALTNADLAEDPRIRAVGDATFLERLRTAACTAQELGLHWDITLGSGWSTGGVGIDDDGARQLIAAELTLEGPSSYSGALPSPEPPAWIEGTNRVLLAIDGFDEELRLVSVLGAEVANESENPPATLGDIVELTDQVQDGTLSWEVPAGAHRVFAIYENRTLHFPAGGAYPGAIANAGVTPSLGPVDSAGLQISVVRRQVNDGDIYFLFNESYEERSEQLRIEDAFTDAVLFDPETGQAIATERSGDTATVTLAGARGVLLWVARAK